MTNIQQILSLFFSFATINKDKGDYARQTMFAKKLLQLYTHCEVVTVLEYIASHKADFGEIRSLAFIPYIFSDVMSKIGKEEKKKDVELDITEVKTNNSNKAVNFGNKREEWSDMFDDRVSKR